MHHASVLLDLLLPTLLAASPRPAEPPRTVTLEIVDTPASGKAVRTRLELPVDGELETVVAHGSDGRARPRVCGVKSHFDTAHGASSLQLDCGDLELAVRPRITIGKRSTLAKIERPGGGTTEVVATWR